MKPLMVTCHPRDLSQGPQKHLNSDPSAFYQFQFIKYFSRSKSLDLSKAEGSFRLSLPKFKFSKNPLSFSLFFSSSSSPNLRYFLYSSSVKICLSAAHRLIVSIFFISSFYRKLLIAFPIQWFLTVTLGCRDSSLFWDRLGLFLFRSVRDLIL